MGTEREERLREALQRVESDLTIAAESLPPEYSGLKRLMEGWRDDARAALEEKGKLDG